MFKKADRAAWAVTLEQYKPSGILVTMFAMIAAVVILAMFLATDEPTKTEQFIATVEKLDVERKQGVMRRFLVVKIATGESVSVPIDDQVEIRPGQEVRLSRGIAGGGRMMYEFVGYLSDP